MDEANGGDPCDSKITLSALHSCSKGCTQEKKCIKGKALRNKDIFLDAFDVVGIICFYYWIFNSYY